MTAPFTSLAYEQAVASTRASMGPPEDRSRAVSDDEDGLSLRASMTLEHKSLQIPFVIVVLLIAVAITQSFTISTISLLINVDLKYEPAEVTRYWMYVGWAAVLKPIVGLLCDSLVICGERGRPLLLLGCTVKCGIYLTYYLVPIATHSAPLFVLLSVCAYPFSMCTFIPVNGLLVEVGRKEEETKEETTSRMSAVMSKAMVWRSVGHLTGMLLQTCLVVFFSVRDLLGVSALFFMLLVSVVLLTPHRYFDRPATMEESSSYTRVSDAFKTVHRSFRSSESRGDGLRFLWVLLFVFFYTLMPDASSVYYNYLFGAFSFPMWFYSMNNCIGVVGAILGSYIFSLWMSHRASQEARGVKRTSMFFIFAVGSVAWAFGYGTNILLCTGFATTTIGIPAAVYIPIDSFIFSTFERFAYMPTIAMAAEYAPKGFEMTVFEIFSVSDIIGGSMSALITSLMAEALCITRRDYSHLWILICISITCKLIPIPAAFTLPQPKKVTEEVAILTHTVEDSDVPVTATLNCTEQHHPVDRIHDDDAASVSSNEPLLRSQTDR